MASFNEGSERYINKTGPESPRRQNKSITGGGPEQLINN